MLLILLIILIVLWFSGATFTSYGTRPYYHHGFGLLMTLLVILIILSLLRVI